jgi:hypothetical protein
MDPRMTTAERMTNERRQNKMRRQPAMLVPVLAFQLQLHLGKRIEDLEIIPLLLHSKTTTPPGTDHS